jgi:hypothetical protein
MTDRETAAAVTALTNMLKLRDTAIREGHASDAEVFAREYVTALRGHGWRPTEAKPPPAWRRPAGTGSQPPADMLAELRADLAARNTGDGAA